MKRNVIATLIAALLVISLLGLANAQSATAGQNVERFGAERHLDSPETMRIHTQGPAA